eukprot:SAG22_NODE_192_length_15668_cov_4.492389_7_plen_231_part_00
MAAAAAAARAAAPTPGTRLGRIRQQLSRARPPPSLAAESIPSSREDSKPKKKKKKKNASGKSAGKSNSKGQGQGKAKNGKGKGKGKGEGKGKNGKGSSNASRKRSNAESGPRNKAAPTPPSSAITPQPVKPWERSRTAKQSENIAASAAWLKKQRKKLPKGKGWLPASRPPPAASASGGDPLIAKLRAMGESRGGLGGDSEHAADGGKKPEKSSKAPKSGGKKGKPRSKL